MQSSSYAPYNRHRLSAGSATRRAAGERPAPDATPALSFPTPPTPEPTPTTPEPAPQITLIPPEKVAKQVRVEGVIELVADAEADAYFASRPKLSQLGAWASKQSQPLEGRMALEKRVAKYTAKFNVGTIPRPGFWSGLRLRPVQIELWKEEAFRLHDRTRYKRDGDGWTVDSLYP